MAPEPIAVRGLAEGSFENTSRKLAEERLKPDEKILLGLLIGLDRVTVEHCPSQNGSDMKDGRSAAFFNIFK